MKRQKQGRIEALCMDHCITYVMYAVYALQTLLFLTGIPVMQSISVYGAFLLFPLFSQGFTNQKEILNTPMKGCTLKTNLKKCQSQKK